MDTQDARQQLEQMLRELDASSAILEAEGAGTGSEISHADQHPGDVAGEFTDADQQNALLDNAAEHREQILAALARIDQGTYGVCGDCGQPIPQARREVRPDATRCLADQEKAEAAGG